jgi:hypothetical protein
MTVSGNSGSDVFGAIQEGMRVVDSAGDEVGTVETIRAADPGATTSQGQAPDETGGAVPGVAGVPLAAPGASPAGGSGGVPGSAGVPAVPAGAVPPASGAEPDLPPALAERYLREGYIKVDSKGFFKRDVYVSREQIAEVAEDAVRLTVQKSELAKEG